LADRLRQVNPEVKTLYMSVLAEESALASLPGAAYLQKPFTLGVLLEKVRGVLAE
jgi:hypothetical protein